MNSRRFDPQHSTVSPEKSPGYDAGSPQQQGSPLSGHTEYPEGTQSQKDVSNLPYSSHIDPAISINMPQRRPEDESAEHFSQYWDSSSSSLSSHRQLGLEGIRSSSFLAAGTADSPGHYSAGEHNPMLYKHKASDAWEPTKESLGLSFSSLLSRRVLAASMAVSGLLIAGFMGYSLLKKSKKQRSHLPPIIEADTAPVKVAPQASISKDEPNKKDMRIYEKINGNLPEQEEGGMSPRGQAFAPKNETPLIDASSQLMSQNLGDGKELSANTDTQVAFPPPKQVKTVIMRPDGTVVSQSVKSEEHKQLSSTSETHENMLSDSTPVARESKEGAAAQSSGLQKKNVETPKTAAGRYEDGAPNGGRGFSVQLAATGSEKEALTFFDVLKRRYGVLNEKTPTIYKANLGGKIVYRLRIKTVSQEESKALCQSIQAQGGACFIARN